MVDNDGLIIGNQSLSSRKFKCQSFKQEMYFHFRAKQNLEKVGFFPSKKTTKKDSK